MNDIIKELALLLNNNQEFQGIGKIAVVQEYSSKYDDFKFFTNPQRNLYTPAELIAFIRVYRTFRIQDFAKSIKTLSKIKAKLSHLTRKEIFVGACVQNENLILEEKLKPILKDVETELREFYSKDSLVLDSMTFGKQYLVRYWDRREDLRECPTYSFYKFKDDFSAESYFQGNVKEHILIIAKQKPLNEEMERDYYHLPTGKEAYNLEDLTIKLDNAHYM